MAPALHQRSYVEREKERVYAEMEKSQLQPCRSSNRLALARSIGQTDMTVSILSSMFVMGILKGQLLAARTRNKSQARRMLREENTVCVCMGRWLCFYKKANVVVVPSLPPSFSVLFRAQGTSTELWSLLVHGARSPVWGSVCVRYYHSVAACPAIES